MIRPADIETTALGAAFAAGIAVGVWSEDKVFLDETSEVKPEVFHPVGLEELRQRRYKSWCTAVERSFDLADLTIS